MHPAASSYFPSLSNLFSFLHERLLPYLPVPHRGDFAASFYIPLSEIVQSKILLALIPSNIADLAPYLALVREAIDFEAKLVNMGFFLGVEHRMRVWGDNVQSHYEKKRRAELLDKARIIILTDLQPPVHIEVEVPLSTLLDNSEEEVVKAIAADEEVNWDFDNEEETTKANGHAEKEDEEPVEDGWGFDDDLPKDDEQKDENNDPWGIEWEDPPAPLKRESLAEKAAKTPTSARPRESYLVSHVATSIAALAREILNEGFTLMRSR
jgi:centromere/kinetochore protein ZW10